MGLFAAIFIISSNTSCISSMSSLSALLPVIHFYAITLFPPSSHHLLKPIITTMVINYKTCYSYSFYFLPFYYLICLKTYLYNSSIVVIYNKRPIYGSLLFIPWMIRIESKSVLNLYNSYLRFVLNPSSIQVSQ